MYIDTDTETKKSFKSWAWTRIFQLRVAELTANYEKLDPSQQQASTGSKRVVTAESDRIEARSLDHEDHQ
jgi:hypothetical protein